MSQVTGELAGGRSATPSKGAWDALADRAEAPPFLRSGWFGAWMGAFGGGAALETVGVHRDGELVAAIPLLRRRGALRSPTNWHTPMFGPLALDAAARDELLAALFAERGAVDLDNFGGAGTEAEAVTAAARGANRRVAVRHLVRSPVIHLEGDFEAYEGTLSRNRRKALRRHRRKLEEQGRLEFEVHDGSADLERLLGELFAVEASGWKGERGTAISSRPETERFYAEVARWAAERGWLRLAFHRLDGRPIACDFALEQGGAWFTLKAGYEDDLRSFGPGALLLRDEIAHCCERGISRIELLGEEDEFKASWTDSYTERVRVRAYRRGPLGAAHGAAAAGWERLRPGLRDLKRKLGR